ncbi:MAG: response regulator transcription factor [Solobacterium sp.]|nr:response regulator transcription factor [Solobacterium sp.]
MNKVLIVDDEKNIREVVREYCELNHYEVMEANDGTEALSLLTQHTFSCIVLDVMMPKLDGYSTLKEIKKITSCPVIMLSARQEEYDKLLSFELGVDDYLTKPFSPKELMARIKVIIDRNQKQTTDRIQVGKLCIDILGRTVSIGQERLPLTPKEIDLLIFMAQRKNIALSRQVLLESVWNYDYFGDERTVDSHIKMLRHNLREYRNCIVTVRGMGYKFEA